MNLAVLRADHKDAPLAGGIMRNAQTEKSIHGFPISATIEIDGSGRHDIKTGIGFLNHLLELLARYGDFDIIVQCEGDLGVDDHHTVDEVAMALGRCFGQALATSSTPITRGGFYMLPMDEALTTVSLDICGRAGLVFDVAFSRDSLGGLSCELIGEFWRLFAQGVPLCMIVKSEFGTNDHHIAEGLFKTVGRALKMACAVKSSSP